MLSWSLIGPIQRIDSRLAAIASGNFSGHVDVTNRDELGALAANVNRMNDELQRLYRELETASRHKSEFLANMSHELRTPLNAIIGFSQVLRDGLFGEVNAKQEEYLEDILTSGHHLLALINDVLDLSKVEAGQVQLELAPFSIAGRTRARRRRWCASRRPGTAFRSTLACRTAASTSSTGDERRVRQVIFNLLSNAVKFTPAGGLGRRHRNAGERRGAGSSVADTGPGIAADDLGRIFEEFQQTEAGARQHEGTGLGLALSRRFVEMHGGRIWVRQRSRQGKHVRVHDPGGGGRAMTRPADPRGGGQRAEHAAVPRRARGCRSTGRSRRRPANARSSWPVEHAPDLVLMDIQLPGIGGVEALGRLRADERTRAVPVLALTAQAMEGDRERFLAAGFDGYLSKPVDIADLVDTVRRYGRSTTR